MLDAAYTPSLWRVWDITRRLLLAVIMGSLSPDALVQANHRVHQSLANPSRQRQPHINYPVKGLS